MVQIHPSPPSLHTPADKAVQHRKALVATVITLTTVGVVLQTLEAWYNPEPYHTSVLSGEAWVNEMIDGHSDRLMDNTGL
ncbi:hypothetical protein L208DRAFT_1315018 [Tricholoma matsutake]|nr:hypothetical protein L208DRAFT_1315018 [Tricholoma matsutake 945]